MAVRRSRDPWIEVIRDRWWKWMLVIVATAGAAGVVWALPDTIYRFWPKPQVETHITVKQKDIRDALEFQNALLMSKMTVDEIIRAEKLYHASRKGRAEE